MMNLKNIEIQKARLKTFQVPVWFNVQAEDQEDAWRKIADLMDDKLFLGVHQDWTVEEPVEIRDDD